MGLIKPELPDYDPLEWAQLPFPARCRQVCVSWAEQGYGTPVYIFAIYGLKIGLYVGLWLLFIGEAPVMSAVAFQKAILWSMLFEILGLGCGSGPLTGRYFPPVGGLLHFLRPGTVKMPMVSVLGDTRNLIDVGLYAALLVALGWGLSASTIEARHLWPIVGLLLVMALFDRTVFLAARGEHYYVTVLCFVFAEDWIPAAMCVQLALWFWAGVSKLNHHFPTVVCVMTSNSPILRLRALRRRMYRRFPDDLNPSGLAVWLSHGGTALELAVPVAFLLSVGSETPVVALVLMVFLHGYITGNVPMGVPLEWNVMVVYGGFFLFGAHPEVHPFSVAPTGLAVVLACSLVVVPLVGNLVPHRLSFLLSMRYYAGNWPMSVWLFRGDSHQKLDALVKVADWPEQQVTRVYPRSTAVALIGKVLAFRAMHLHGRALSMLIPKAVERFEDYTYMDGEVVAGLALGWNFGDGHLHNERLLASIQRRCKFEPGELRVIMVEPQPLGQGTQRWRIADAATGAVEAGVVRVSELRQRQPWGAAD
ncbi:MAG: DUF3556 domain-containing protein [Bradymonadia bacterium]